MIPVSVNFPYSVPIRENKHPPADKSHSALAISVPTLVKNPAFGSTHQSLLTAI